MSSTVLLSDISFDLHTLPGHVERAERLQAVRQAIAAAGLEPDLDQRRPRPAPDEALLAAHTAQLLQLVRRLSSYGGGQIDHDTYVTADSWEVAALAAGAAIDAVEAVAGATARNAFALTRPPGHHATATRPMGFCLVNHVAVAARHVLDTLGVGRLAIVDYDVHHGNGTQDIFYGEGRALFCSTHVAPLYPGSGAAGELGENAGYGATLNVPLPHGTGDAGYAYVFEALIGPALRRHRPELILVSAGYDAHWSDPLGPAALSVAGYAALNQTLLGLADELCGGRIVFVLEGGYSLPALGAGVVATLRQLLGRPPGADPLGPSRSREPDIAPLIAAIRGRHPLLRNG